MDKYEGHQHSPEHTEVSIIEAVETLTSIADLEIDGPIAIAEKHDMELQELPVIYRTVHWLHRKNAEKVMDVVRDTFRTILNYLRHFYKAEFGKMVHHESVEGIKTIMVLVGEAAKKVDKYSRVFVGVDVSSVKESKEFRDLWTFYQRKIAPIAVQESLSRWIRQLPIKVVEESIRPDTHTAEVTIVPSTEHLFVDLDTVKKDSDYELFLIRKEDGSRFFNPRLLRNIKLVCNFEDYYNQEEKEASLVEIQGWKNSVSRQIAQNIVRQNWHLLDLFLKAAHRHYNDEVVSLLYRAVTALVLAANQANVVKEPYKDASGYLADFQRFFRQLLVSADFQRIVTYLPKNEEAIQHKVVTLVQNFCRSCYSGFHITPDTGNLINELLVKGEVKQGEETNTSEMLENSLSARMAIDYDAILRAMQPYGHVPLIKIIETLHDVDINGYDPLLLQNMPMTVFNLSQKGKHIGILRIPSPTTQEYIHKASVAEECKAFLRNLSQDEEPKELLLFNFQDRTSLREYARCTALEELQKKEEFAKQLVVVSMTKDSDFYHQIGPYQELNLANTFIDHLVEHVTSESSGYYLPEKIRKELTSNFLKRLAYAIHSTFFGSKNVMSRHSRLDFIELFYIFVELKIIEIVKPGYVGFCCKDAIDISMPAVCEFFLLLKLLNARPVSSEEEEYLKVLLYGPAIYYRGRALFLDRFSRMNSMTRLIEVCMEEEGLKAFHEKVAKQIGPLFDREILHAVVNVPQPIL